MAETNKIGKEERTERLWTMLENIAAELAPMYEGKLSVNKAYYDKNMMYIALEQEKTKRFLFWNCTSQSIDVVFAVAGRFSDNLGEENRLGVLKKNRLYDENDELVNVIHRHLKKYKSECDPLNIHSENFRYVLDK